MSEHICKHSHEVIDEHEGSVICVDCGVVKDFHFINISSKEFNKETLSSPNSLSRTILDKVNLPEHLSNFVDRNLLESGKNSLNLKSVTSEIYETINEKATHSR